MNAALKQERDDVSKKVEDKCSPQGYPLTTASNSVACIYLGLFLSQKEYKLDFVKIRSKWMPSKRTRYK